MSENDELLTLRDAAVRLGVHADTLRQAVNSEGANHLDAKKLGRDWFVRWSVVKAWNERPRSKGGRPRTRKLGA